ncbi:MAG: acyl-CoA dehydrogenase family protein [Acidimicrobiales bacterium]
MDLEFTPEQDMLRQAVRGICTRFAGREVVRAMEDDPKGYPAEFWAQLGDLGTLGLTIPERWGGSGMSMLDAVVVYEEFGRSLAPSPHFVSSVVSGGVIAAAGSDDQRQAWLPRIAAGTVVVTPAWLEPDRGFGPRGVMLEAHPRAGGGLTLSGVKRHVAFAGEAARLLVLARVGLAVDDPTDGLVLALVDPGAPGVTLTRQRTMATDTQYRAEFDCVAVEPGAVIGLPGQAWQTWDSVLHDGIVLLAAQAVGGARYALEIAVQYAQDRRQFDKPLGAFQAIAHYLADAVTEVDGAETLVWEAAVTRDLGRDVSRLAPMAKLFACGVFRDTTAMAQQVFGGIGFTVDHDIQLYFRRAKQLQISWWDTAYLEELVAAAVLDRV